MLDIKTLNDQQKSKLIDNLWRDVSVSLWDVMVSKEYEKNKKIWQNTPEWLNEVPRKRSKARDNRIFLAMESVISTLTSRPSKPNVVNVIETEPAKQLSNNLQDVFIQKYGDLGMKEKMRRGLRSVFLSRFICFKIVYDKGNKDFDIIKADSRNIRVSKKCTSMYDTDFVIEKVDDISLKTMIERFPEKEEKIIKLSGFTREQIITENPSTEYYEAWIDGMVLYKFRDEILFEEKHPYWDWKGIKLTTQEAIRLKSGDTSILKGAIKNKDKRNLESLSIENGGKGKMFESAFYNYFDRPIPPYVFGTVLALENKPVGDSSLIDQVLPLQEELDKRTRQISDNAEMANGQYKIDTNLVTITKAEATAAKSDPRGIWYGKGVTNGVSIMQGKDLPNYVIEDRNHSITEIDNIFGTGPTFRGEGGKQETAMGRAILREQSYSRLDELIDLVDNLYQQIYSWMYQMMRIFYEEDNFLKIVGEKRAKEIVNAIKNEFNDGIKIKVIPGQILPQDRLFRAERATDEIKSGIIDPLTYFEDTERDNPMDLAKRVIMFKLDPTSVLQFTPEEMAKMQAGAKSDQDGQKAKVVGMLKSQAEELSKSPEFQKLPPEEQERAITLIENKIKEIVGQ